MLPPPFAWAGVDWSMSAHQVCLLRPHAKALQRSFPHSAAGLQEMVAWLASEAGCEPAALYTAIEVPHGPVVSALLAAGFSTFSINPKQLDRFRDRRSLAGAKDDRRDALTLADSLRTDLPAFSEVTLPDDLILAIRGASRRRDTLLPTSSHPERMPNNQPWRIGVQHPRCKGSSRDSRGSPERSGISSLSTASPDSP